MPTGKYITLHNRCIQFKIFQKKNNAQKYIDIIVSIINEHSEKFSQEKLVDSHTT